MYTLSGACCSRATQTRWLKTIHIRLLPALKTTSPEPECWQGHTVLEGSSFAPRLLVRVRLLTHAGLCLLLCFTWSSLPLFLSKHFSCWVRAQDAGVSSFNLTASAKALFPNMGTSASLRIQFYACFGRHSSTADRGVKGKGACLLALPRSSYSGHLRRLCFLSNWKGGRGTPQSWISISGPFLPPQGPSFDEVRPWVYHLPWEEVAILFYSFLLLFEIEILRFSRI